MTPPALTTASSPCGRTRRMREVAGSPSRWPRHRKQMLANMEKYLEVGDQVVKIVSYRTAEHRRKRPDGLPAALMSVLPLLERACPSAVSPDATAALDA